MAAREDFNGAVWMIFDPDMIEEFKCKMEMPEEARLAKSEQEKKQQEKVNFSFSGQISSDIQSKSFGWFFKSLDLLF